MTPRKQSRNMSFQSDDSDMMEDASVASTPPRSGRGSLGSLGRFSSARESPKNRRLFEDASDDELGLSPPRRSLLRPLDLNNDVHSAENAVPFANLYAQPQGGRKRSSLERRSGETTPRLDTSSDGSDQAMYASPHISPSSFLTMDGRFVQSKNPFSSPMVMDEEQHFTNNTIASMAPTLPVSFNDSKIPSISFLPPRLHRTLQRHRESNSPVDEPCKLNGGYPDHRFSFTGSPIQEDAMELSDTASRGSLHKVRRFNQSDDVFAASGQHLSCLKTLTINTNLAAGEATDDISPTEVMNFPPPTPVKARPVRAPYAPIRRGDPKTPMTERRRNIPVRTPHPGSYFQEKTVNQQPKSRFYSDFDVMGELGRGSFGSVYKVLSRLDGCMYAIKAAQRKAKGASDRQNMLREVYALAALSDHADTATFHIVRYHQAWMEDDRLYIQTELCSGTLAEEISKDILTERRRYKVLREILLALEFIHRQGMVHLDIKPDNIFLKKSEDQYKLGDFGLVTRASNSQEVDEGDSRYMSRELLSGDRSDLTKSDIFSLGATMYEISLMRPLPMNGPEWQDMRSGILFPMPNTSQEMSMIIRRMMDPVATRRPTASQLLQHPQLLSDEQKALNIEKSKVIQANMQLAAQAHMMMPKPMKRGLQRANTWNGSSLPYV